jgi:hypothetical protein
VRWTGDREAFERWCIETRDLRDFGEAVTSAPEDERSRLRDLLRRPGPGEPEAEQLRSDMPLAERMRSPLAVLLRQVRLEKLRLLDEL